MDFHPKVNRATALRRQVLDGRDDQTRNRHDATEQAPQRHSVTPLAVGDAVDQLRLELPHALQQLRAEPGERGLQLGAGDRLHGASGGA